MALQYDYLIVGAGLFGAVFAQQARECGKSVLVVEKRQNVGGNCYSYEYQDTGIIIHAYGTHIFHTSDQRVWEYVNRFTRFNRYQHRVLTNHRGKIFALPINLGTINAFFGLSLTPEQARSFLDSRRPRIANPRNLEEQAIGLIGPELYEAFIRGYTKKQWGCDPRELPASIITRLPIRTSFFDSYFDDVYQGIPIDGYTPMFERLLGGIPVELGVDFLKERETLSRKARKIVYTGPADLFFENCLGRLNWRSVRFEVERRATADYQGTAVMNYADVDVPYTRIHEPKHLHLEKPWNSRETVIIREYSQVDNDAPYYPVNFEVDRQRYFEYSKLQEKETNVIFGGRLAAYKYYDMHQVIASALVAVRKEISGRDQLTRGRQFSGDELRYGSKQEPATATSDLRAG
jgi:UDP-galactopyranose mutase